MAKPEPIRVLSIRQPFADLIIHGNKWCENRSWHTNYRGELWIHSSRWESSERRVIELERADVDGLSPGRFKIGAIIGRVDLLATIGIDQLRQRRGLPDELLALIPPARAESWDHVAGPVCWILANPRPLKTPIITSGKLNVWKFDAQPAALTCTRHKRKAVKS